MSLSQRHGLVMGKVSFYWFSPSWRLSDQYLANLVQPGDWVISIWPIQSSLEAEWSVFGQFSPAMRLGFYEASSVQPWDWVIVGPIQSNLETGLLWGQFSPSRRFSYYGANSVQPGEWVISIWPVQSIQEIGLLLGQFSPAWRLSD